MELPQSPIFLGILGRAQFGLSHDLDQLCRRRALESARALGGDQVLFITCLASLLSDDAAADRGLSELMAHTGCPPERLILEVAEGHVHRATNVEDARSADTEFQGAGAVGENRHAFVNSGGWCGYIDARRMPRDDRTGSGTEEQHDFLAAPVGTLERPVFSETPAEV